MSKNNKNPHNLKEENILNQNVFQFSIDLVQDSFVSYELDNSFTVFKSINNILYLVYSNEKNSVISFNLTNNKKINEIKNAHGRYISNIRYYLDDINKKDLILTISSDDNNIKVWNFNNYECIVNIMHINKDGFLFSAYFLKDNNQIYIITSNCYWKNNDLEPIKAYDLNGNKIKEINNSNDRIFFIDTYFDNKSSRNYIISGCRGFVKSFDFNRNIIYHKYCEYDSKVHCSLTIYNDEEITKLIESCDDGHIRIWDFHSGELLNRIRINDIYLYGICIWNNHYLFVGCKDEKSKMIDLSKGVIVKELEIYDNNIVTIKSVNHPIYGECLITQNFKDNRIKLWIK